MLLNGSNYCRSWVEISLDNAEKNYSIIRKRVNNSSKICCVVKANAYGNGDVVLSKLYENLGADYLAVANLDEGVRLRRAGITIPILNFGKILYHEVEIAHRFDIVQTVYSRESFEIVSLVAKTKGIIPKVHIKIDTGMNRLGFSTDKSDIEFLYNIFRQKCLKIEGIYSHLSCSNEQEDRFTLNQIHDFLRVTKTLQDKGFCVGLRHILNSAGIINYPEYSLDMVRAGVALYGVKPCATELPINEITCVKSSITQIKKVYKGERISYNGKPLNKCVKIAVLPLGYADGVLRRYGRFITATVGGMPVKVIGKICMDQMMIDVSNIKVSLGDEVIVLGNTALSIQTLAEKVDTIGYEIMTSLSNRLPRRYV